MLTWWRIGDVIDNKITKYRIVLIGGGPGGYEAARDGVQLGA